MPNPDPAAENRFATENPIPSTDDGSPTEYEKNAARVLAENPPVEQA